MLKLATVALAVAIVATSALVAARPKWHELEGYTFEQYVDDFGKAYPAGTSEYKMRKSIFLDKLAQIKKHNADKSQSWKGGVNMYTDMTKQEWKRFNAFKKSSLRPASKKLLGSAEAPFTVPSGYVIPKTVDWRLAVPPVLTPVKHQGSCGCCWACSAAESMESYHAMQTGNLVDLSFQQITSCTPAPMSYGCDGGDYAMGWLNVNQSGYPVNEEAVYGFSNFFFPTSGPGVTAACYNVSSKFINHHPYNWFAQLPQVGINGYGSIAVNNATAAQIALATLGPQSISVAAGNWQWYETGVFENTASSGADNEWQIDHAVQMVGYGEEVVEVNGARVTKGYWIVRNSWSAEWGQSGYIYLARPDVEPCSPVEYGPVCGTSGCLSDLQFPETKRVKSIPF